jgi:Flp pilus assembly protein TadG
VTVAIARSRREGGPVPEPATPRARWRGDGGATLVTFLLLFPILIVFAELIVLGGRVAATRADVQSAAREGARQASIASGPAAVPSVMADAADTALADQGYRCQSHSVQVGPGTNFVAEGTAGGQVEIVVSCTVLLSDLDLLSVPGSITITRSAVEPIDTYRAVD